MSAEVKLAVALVAATALAPGAPCRREDREAMVARWPGPLPLGDRATRRPTLNSAPHHPNRTA